MTFGYWVPRGSSRGGKTHVVVGASSALLPSPLCNATVGGDFQWSGTEELSRISRFIDCQRCVAMVRRRLDRERMGP